MSIWPALISHLFCFCPSAYILSPFKKKSPCFATFRGGTSGSGFRPLAAKKFALGVVSLISAALLFSTLPASRNTRLLGLPINNLYLLLMGHGRPVRWTKESELIWRVRSNLSSPVPPV